MRATAFGSDSFLSVGKTQIFPFDRRRRHIETSEQNKYVGGDEVVLGEGSASENVADVCFAIGSDAPPSWWETGRDKTEDRWEPPTVTTSRMGSGPASVLICVWARSQVPSTASTPIAMATLTIADSPFN